MKTNFLNRALWKSWEFSSLSLYPCNALQSWINLMTSGKGFVRSKITFALTRVQSFSYSWTLMNITHLTSMVINGLIIVLKARQQRVSNNWQRKLFINCDSDHSQHVANCWTITYYAQTFVIATTLNVVPVRVFKPEKGDVFYGLYPVFFFFSGTN